MSGSRLQSFLSSNLTVKQFKEIHAQVLINCLNQLEPLLIHRILLFTHNFSRCIAQYVKQILNNLQKQDAFPWGCTIRFLSQHGRFKEAFSLYVQLRKLGLCPSTHAISSTLKGCAKIEDKVGGISIHAQVYRYGFCGCVYVQTALIDLYSKVGDMKMAQKVFDDIIQKNIVSWNSILFGHLKSGNLVEAHKVFDEIPEKDVISWNSILSGYARVGKMDLACSFFHRMPERNLVSWNAIISGFVDRGNIEVARTFFDTMPKRNNVSWITMISGYSKDGDVKSARELFDRIYEKDQFSYNAMIACYSQNSQPKEALKVFSQMMQTNAEIQPDEITFASVISACSQFGDMRFGMWIESCAKKLGIKTDDHMATALIDLYMKCGNINRAYELFHSLRKKDLVAYSTMILGFGINGRADDAINLFKAMIDAKICPNLATFTGLLTACSHAGFVEEGYRCFHSMMDNGLVPSVDHYGIMVDMLGRAGRLEEAYELIKSMPMQPHAGVWGALLLACKVHNNLEFGEIAAQHCFELEPDTIEYWTLLSNIYSSFGKWDDVMKLRMVMEEKKLSRMPGCSWVESI